MTMLRPAAVVLLAACAVTACASAASSAGPPTSSPPPAGSAPSDGSGTSAGDPGATPDPNAPVEPGGGLPFDPNGGRIVIPKLGQLGVHPVPAQMLSATVTGRRVVVTIAYTSGVEPCNVLDSILVRPGPGSFGITLREGHGPDDVACIEIAEYRRAIVDLGALEPGTYTITDDAGVAAPISVTVA